MDTMIRNLDDELYRKLKARAARTGRTIGETLNEAIRAYLARPIHVRKARSLRELRPEDYAEGNERLSQEVDAVVYGS